MTRLREYGQGGSAGGRAVRNRRKLKRHALFHFILCLPLLLLPPLHPLLLPPGPAPPPQESLRVRRPYFRRIKRKKLKYIEKSGCVVGEHSRDTKAGEGGASQGWREGGRENR